MNIDEVLKDKELDKHIVLISDPTDQYLAGWYFTDESWQMHGPFNTIEETRELLQKYIKELG
jgi:hypothetical protein